MAASLGLARWGRTEVKDQGGGASGQAWAMQHNEALVQVPAPKVGRTLKKGKGQKLLYWDLLVFLICVCACMGDQRGHGISRGWGYKCL